MRKSCYKWTMALAFLAMSFTTAFAEVVNPSAVTNLLNRIGGEGAANRFVVILDGELSPNDKEVFVISEAKGKPCIKGSSLSAITTGVNWYLNHYAHINLTWNQLTTDFSQYKFPLPKKEERHETSADYRYYLNYCTFSYSMSVWTWERWQQEIDWMALHGINMPLQIVGLDVVWYKLLTEKYGYTHDEANAFVAGPCFQAWWGMNNLEGWGGPNPEWWYKRQATLSKNICDRMRELGMQPVLPGYSGMVPSDFVKKTGKQANNQGNWCTFVRPYIFDPNSDAFGEMAKEYYCVLEEVMGQSEYYSMDPFHEGANTRGIDVPSAYKKIAGVMLDAHPEAKWVIQFWQWSGAQYHVLDQVEKGKLIILDLFSDAHTHFNAYKGHDAVYCMLPNFGGRTGFCGRFDKVIRDFFSYQKQYPNIKGIGATPEAIESVPVGYDILFELPWYKEQPDGKAWMKEYANSRYGEENKNAQAAWEKLRLSALNCQTALQGPHEAVLCARPSLTVDRVSSWGGSTIFYNPQDVVRAAYLLLEAKMKGENYSYDLTDITRQALTDYGYALLKSVNEAYVAGDTIAFSQRRDAFLGLILDLDRLLSTNKDFMLGRWTNLARGIADEMSGTTKADRDWLELDNARTLITTWGNRNASDYGGLRDYSYREWGGMMKDYYYPRWKAFFDNLSAPHDWFAMEWDWAHNANLSYSDQPVGKTADVAAELFSKYFLTLTSEKDESIYIYRGMASGAPDDFVPMACRGDKYKCAVAKLPNGVKAQLMVDFNHDGDFSKEEITDGLRMSIPKNILTGEVKAMLKLSDGTVWSFRLLIKDNIKAERQITAKSEDDAQGTVQVNHMDLSHITNKEAVVLTATAASGYDFAYWQNAAGKQVSSDPTFTYYGKETETFTAHFLINKWGTPKEDLCDINDIRSYRQYVSQISVTQSDKEHVVYTTANCPEKLFNVAPQRITVARGSRLSVDWKDAGGLSYTYLTVYIDLNNDGKFDGEKELVAVRGKHNTTSSEATRGPLEILLPYDMPVGITHLRLRFDGAWRSEYDASTGAFDANLSLNRMCYDLVLDVVDHAPYACTVGVKSADTAFGTVDANGQPDIYTYRSGEPVILRAYPADGYRLAYWQDAYGRRAPQKWMQGHNLKFKATENGTFTAVFEKK